MRTIIGSGRDCSLIILFHVNASETGLFQGNLFWVGEYDALTFILEEKLIQYYYNTIFKQPI